MDDDTTGADVPAKVNILGVNVSAVNEPAAIQIMNNWISNKQPNYVCVTGVHGVMECQRDQKLMDIHNRAGLVTPDGMPIVLISRFRGFSKVNRVYGPDLMLGICKDSVSHGYRHYFYGGEPGVPELLAGSIQERFPGLVVAGTYSPPFRNLNKEEDEEIIKKIKSTSPDFVWIGLGTPKQEKWMADHVERLDGAVLVGVGAAFDFHSGRKRQAPKWIRRSGFEWLFRLMTEPKRLWKRYLVNNPLFLSKLLLQELNIVRYE